ncbi:hypothetical protein [Nocardiopsis algeriensis]|uniref:Uncharacterized protein n=1 Tax=Nocardiopsis algeriensis TaxID=1478215 RepID=A0A841IRL2_9ACTN|nr:hypothetical protein [Nocardiopsis algeriensis]MBB6119906.1 hypothetical protein [Nocardiopsis algeriensis]
MVDDFRAAFQELIDASVAADPQHFPPAVHKVYTLASQVPAAERALALEALTPLLTGDHAAPGITADLSIVAGALVEMGTDPGPAGIETLRRLRTMGKGALVFTRAWQRTGTDAPPDPDTVTADDEQRVTAHLGDKAPRATMCWWTIRRHGLAAKTMLCHSDVRAQLHADPDLHTELTDLSEQLGTHLPEFEELGTLLAMDATTTALVLDRASGRAFRVRFDGIGDNFQLHTLLADALIGPQGRGLDGERPDPRWVSAFRDGEPDPQAHTVRGWWNLVAHDGTWVWNEGVPADIPTLDGEHLLVLDELPYPRSWNAERRHPLVHGRLEVESELEAEEAQLWWKKVAPTEPALPDPADTADATPIPEPVLADPLPEAERVRGFLPPEPGTETAPEPAPAPALTDTAAAPPPPQAAPRAVPEPAPEPAPTPQQSFLPPLPPGVSKSSAWGPAWR